MICSTHKTLSVLDKIWNLSVPSKLQLMTNYLMLKFSTDVLNSLINEEKNECLTQKIDHWILALSLYILHQNSRLD